MQGQAKVISRQRLPVFAGSAVRMGQWAKICAFALNNLTWTVKKCRSLLCAEQTVKCLWCDWGVRRDCFSLDLMSVSSWTGLDECVDSQVFLVWITGNWCSLEYGVQMYLHHYYMCYFVFRQVCKWKGRLTPFLTSSEFVLAETDCVAGLGLKIFFFFFKDLVISYMWL